MSKYPALQKIGIEPVNIKWVLTRGDTASLRVQFLEHDETTPYTTTNWQYEATAYSKKDNVFDDLIVTLDGTDVIITAPSDLTEFWGTGIKRSVAELNFDLQVQIDRETVWTPIVGTITVIGDVTGGRL